jgi:hypothetical protein
MPAEEIKEKDEKDEGLHDKAKDLISHTGDYLETFYRLSILKFTQKATNVASSVIATVAVCTLGVLVVLFGSFGLAWWLGDVIESRAGGFFIVAGFYLLVLLCIILMRKKIVFPYLRNMIIRKFYE